VAVLIIAVGLKIKYNSLHYFTLTTAFVGIFELGIWILFLFIEADVYLHGHTFGAYGVYCLAVTLGALLSLNLVSVYLFNRYIK
jgi:hypothetical protein